MIRPISPLDAAQICTIYNHYVDNTVVTVEEEHVSDSEMAQRIKNVTSSLPWFVSENEGVTHGYAYATPWRTRSAALPNPASVALHEKLGSEKVAELKEVDWKLGRWVDVGYWELIL